MGDSHDAVVAMLTNACELLLASARCTCRAPEDPCDACAAQAMFIMAGGRTVMMPAANAKPMPLVRGGQGRPDYPAADVYGVGIDVAGGGRSTESAAFGCSKCGVKVACHDRQPNYRAMLTGLLCHDCVTRQAIPEGRGVTTMGDEAARLPVPGGAK